jgi:PAS domain S-box-containing protein
MPESKGFVDRTTFASKFLSRLQRIDTNQIESFVTQLLREKDFQKTVLDSILDGVVVAGGDGRVVFANEAARGLLGLGGREVIGQPLRKVLRSRVLQAVADEFLDARKPVLEREVRVRTPGSRVYSVSIIPVEGAGPADGGALWLVSDRTASMRRAAERQQVENMRSLATLTAGIAHEIKNPLNSMNIHAQLITQGVRSLAGKGVGEPELKRLEGSASVLLEEISRLARIVDQFIKAVRPAPPDLRVAALGPVVEAVADLVRPECVQRNIELEVDMDTAIPALLMDPAQIQQALLNITKNAMEAVDKPEGHVTLRTTLQDDHVLLEVEDNGCGIPEENRLSIFEPYHTTKFDGSGLGLMVVFNIVSAHRGAIGLDSEVGRGTVFRLALPLSERPVRLLGGPGITPPDAGAGG